MLINIDVPDLQRAVRFYEGALGLRRARMLFGGTVAEMLGAAAPIYLLEKAERSSPTPDGEGLRTYARHWTPLHLDVVVHDLGPALERALQAGATLEQGPTSFAWGRMANLSDPFGHGLCLIQWTGKGYGEVEAEPAPGGAV